MGPKKAKTTSFPIPAYQSVAEGWRTCPLKALNASSQPWRPRARQMLIDVVNLAKEGMEEHK
jgi:hypothetical protein